jgi:hypothetical protein
MTDDEAKFDVRVRQRLVTSGVLKEAEIEKHLEGLRDVGEQAVAVVAKQPALQSESDRDIVIVRTSGVRPPPMPPRLNDLESTPIDDDLDDDDDDDDELPVKKPAAEKPAVEKPAPAADADEEDEDDDDDDSDGEGGGEGSGEGSGEEKKDDDWGESST